MLGLLVSVHIQAAMSGRETPVAPLNKAWTVAAAAAKGVETLTGMESLHMSCNR